MIEPGWLIQARTWLGTREIHGPRHNPIILGWLHRLRAWWQDDEVPWCGTFVAACMDAVGVPLPTHWMRARAWLDWGVPLPLPLVGCVVVFERQGGGHVGFVVGRNERGHLLVLGGNQGNAVTIAAFDRPALGYRWPAGEPMPIWNAELPVGEAARSTSEA